MISYIINTYYYYYYYCCCCYCYYYLLWQPDSVLFNEKETHIQKRKRKNWSRGL